MSEAFISDLQAPKRVQPCNGYLDGPACLSDLQGLQPVTSPRIGYVGFDQLEKIPPKSFDCHFQSRKWGSSCVLCFVHVSGDFR
ncbi:protein of unknown function (plasmid) [Pararobbsia alpina]